VAKLNVNKPKVLLIFLAIFAALFFGLASLAFVQLVNTNYIFLLAPPVVLLIGLLFIFDRYAFFLLVIVMRASLDSAFNAIKIGSFGLGAVLNALVILIALLALLEKPVKLNFDLSSIKKAWLLFLGLGFVSIFYAPSVVSSVKLFLIYVSYGSIFLLGFSLIKTPDDFGKWMKAIALSSLIPVLYSLFSIAIGGAGLKLYKYEGLRLQGPFPHANPFSAYLVFITSFFFYLYKSKAWFISVGVRRFLPAYIFILLGLLLMTKTRSAWAVTYLLFFLYGVFHERKFLIIVFTVPFLALMIPEIQDRVIDLTQGNNFGSTGYERLNSFAWRLQIWQDSIDWMAKSHYLFGYGLASFINYSQYFAMANAFQTQDFDINAHNIYVQTFFELGLFGLIAILYLFSSYIRTFIKIYKMDSLLVFFLIAIFSQILLQAITDNLLDYLTVEWYMWFFIGISISYIIKFKVVKPNNQSLKSQPK
jgi:O-antigen ligase